MVFVAELSALFAKLLRPHPMQTSTYDQRMRDATSTSQGGGPEWNLLLFAWERAKVGVWRVGCSV